MPDPSLVLRGVCAALLIFEAGATAVRAEEGPALGPGDEIEVFVFARPEYETTAQIGADGTVPIRGLGRLRVAGLSPDVVEVEVAEALESLRITAPVVSVQVLAWREVGVLGDVQAPGLYEWRPDMTVLHLLARAGGFRRSDDAASESGLPLREAQGNLSLLLDQLEQADIRRDRIAAQMAGQGAETSPDLPEEDLASYGAAERAIAETSAAARSRDRDILRRQLDAIERQIELRESITETYRSDLEAARSELARLQKLADEGLLPADRLASARDRLSSVTIDSLENDASFADALQDRAAVELALAGLGSGRTEELARELRDTIAEIGLLRTEIDGARDRIRVLRLEADLPAPDDGIEEPVTDYEVLRSVGGEARRLSLVETDAVLPGDVVTVTREFDPDDGPAARP